jgi:hypothetical protein
MVGIGLPIKMYTYCDGLIFTGSCIYLNHAERFSEEHGAESQHTDSGHSGRTRIVTAWSCDWHPIMQASFSSHRLPG